MPRSVSDLIRLRFGWFLIAALTIAIMTPIWMLLVGGEDDLKAERQAYLYQLLYLILGFVLGGSSAAKGEQ
tara:strand:+ start:273 stop:485 length:213 start_codon:yes stop_codon:yes gene_type:complete